MLVPSSMLNVPPGRIPRLDSGVLVVSGTVPVPVAGVGEVGAELDEEVPAAVPEEEADGDELEEPCSTFCIAAESSELTRLRAAPFAMVAKPFPRFVSAWAITLMSDWSAD